MEGSHPYSNYTPWKLANHMVLKRATVLNINGNIIETIATSIYVNASFNIVLPVFKFAIS